MKIILVFLTIFVIALFGSLSARTINIPADLATIQAGIDAAQTDDTVLVAPGSYLENLTFRGYDIVLGSMFITTHDESYIMNTIIDGGARNTVIVINGGEGPNTVVEGLTILNGLSGSGGGGIGIYGSGTSPIIRNNRIVHNISSSSNGGGISCVGGSNPTICFNYIANNRASVWNGGGISCSQSSAYIHNNLIINNFAKL